MYSRTTLRLGPRRTEVSTGGPSGGEHRQHLALPLQTYAQHLQPLLAVPDHHVVQERGTPLGNAGREPPALLSAERSRHVELLLSCCLCAGARRRLIRSSTPSRLHHLYDGEIHLGFLSRLSRACV